MQRDVLPKPIERDLDCIQFVAGIAARLASERGITSACLVVLEEAMALTGTRCGEILLRDMRSGRITCLASRGPYPWCVAETGGQDLSPRLLETVFNDQLPLSISSLAEAPGLHLNLGPDTQLRQALSIPLVVRGRALGAMNLCGAATASFPSETVAALSVLGGLLALTVENMFMTNETTREENDRRQFVIKEMEASEDERQRIARELHDGIGQTLTALLMNMDASIALLSQPGRKAQAQGQMEKSREVAASILQDIRRVILALRPTALDDLGLFPAIDGYARRVLGEAGIEATCRRGGSNDRIPSVVENALFRVLQEAINNVARHSHARQCRLTLSTNEGTVSAIIEDDGVGFDTNGGSNSYDHFGLTGMRERVRVLGGSLQLRSRPGSGTRLTLEVPYRREGDEEEPRRRS